MGSSRESPTGQSPTEKPREDTIVIGDQEKSSTVDEKDTEEQKKNEENASLGNYIVWIFCLPQYFVADCLQRLLSYTNSTDRVILAIAMVCAIGSGVVCAFSLRRK